MNRRSLLAMGAALAFAPLHARAQGAAVMQVTKTPGCGCCSDWVELGRKAGFEIEVTESEDYVGMKEAGEVPEALWSCHTGIVEGYTFEGHVPFEAVRKVLDERPDIRGLAVPGMPHGSPGMGDDPHARFDVIAFGGTAGEGTVFMQVGI